MKNIKRIKAYGAEVILSYSENNPFPAISVDATDMSPEDVTKALTYVIDEGFLDDIPEEGRTALLESLKSGFPKDDCGT